MRRLIVIPFVMVACHRGPKPFRSTGQLVFDTKPADQAKVFLATEAETMRSSAILHRIEQQWPSHAIEPSALSIARHGETMILDVTVTDRDPAFAAEACNHVLQAYVEQRREMVVAESQARMQVLSQQLEASPENADLKRQIQQLDTEAQLARSDVRVLEPCKVPTKR